GRTAFIVPWSGGGCPGLLRTVPVSSAGRQPRELSTVLAGPTKKARGPSSSLARSTLSGRPLDPCCGMRHISGGQVCLAAAWGSGYGHRFQRDERTLYREAQAKV